VKTPHPPKHRLPKNRLDMTLLEQGLCQSRAQAQGLIMSGQVRVDGQPVSKPGTLVQPDAKIEIQESLRYVSRGGLKLEKALAQFKISVENKVCLDVGSSTGGFTDCMLQNGASRVMALDVGSNQLDWSLRNDERVSVHEKTHVNQLNPELCENALGQVPDVVTIDTSFISLIKVLPHVVSVLNEGAVIIALLKPQFEYSEFYAQQNMALQKKFKGVVRDADVHEVILERVITLLLETLPVSLMDMSFSPITGPKGNIEFLLYLKKSSSPDTSFKAEALKERIVELVQESHTETATIASP